jgi:elongation factor P
MISGRVIEKTYKSGESVEEAVVEYSTMTYLYNDGENYSFMDQETFETVEISKENMNGAELWLLDNTTCEVTFWEGKAIEVLPPMFMELEVTTAPPGLRGDTTGHVTRPATLETGAEVQIPLFINEGEKIKVDTRTGEYVERAK